MKLSDIFSQLAYGELSQVSLVDQDTGLISTTKYAPVVAHVNMALTALYTRFNLKENRLLLPLRTNQISYALNSAEDIRVEYGAEDFEDDILKVEKVMTDAGVELSLNDASDIYGCMTPSAAVLRVPLVVVNKGLDLPADLMTDRLELVYRANHPRIVIPTAGLLPAKVNIELPDSHLMALLLYVASRVHNPIGMSNEFHAGNSYYAKYEAECARLENAGMEVDQGSQNTRAGRNGWV